ncbi:hypothetical protein ACP275_07G078700 [Erythranthe tilingii]
MASSSSYKQTPIIIFIFLSFFLILSASISPVFSEPNLSAGGGGGSAAAAPPPANQTFRPLQELKKLKRIRSYLRKINKPSVKTIQSPDGDIIDCIESHLQPAFDHPLLKGQKPLEPPERPKGQDSSVDSEIPETSQSWRDGGESCPEGTIPIKRTTEKDVLRANTVRRFGKKIKRGDEQ